jgi:uncharacterized membrane protein HdeD (DUF308 family)
MSESIHRPWPYLVGGVMAALGVGLVFASQLVVDLPLALTMVALLVGAVIEVVSGESLRRHGGAGMAHLFSGVLVVGFGAFLVAALAFESRAASAAPVALMFGLFCAVNGVFRALDLAIDRPRAVLSEVLDTAVTLALAVVLFMGWRGATPALLGLTGGIDLIAGGLSVAGSARAMWKHPELSAYAR